MKTLTLILLTLPLFLLNNPETYAQRYKEPDLTVSEWMQEDCIVTDRSKLQEAIEKLPQDKVCTALVGETFYLFFTDTAGNRHQMVMLKNDPEYISFAMFDGLSSRVLVMGEFYWGSLLLNQRSYTPLVSEYEGKQYKFRDWKHYFANFSPIKS